MAQQKQASIQLATLGKYKALLDADIEQYCEALLTSTSDRFGRYSHDAMQVYASLLSRGGKRLRGVMVLSAYEMFGGTNKAMIIRAARAVEMLHAYLLIVDDIQDHSQTRRGGPAAHVLLARYHKQNKFLGSSEDFGAAVAVDAALVGCHLAMQELAQLDAPDERKVKMFDLVNTSLLITGHGQINDLFNAAMVDVSESDVLRTLTWKSAYYSFLKPLQAGAVLAGASAKDLAALHDYATHIGLAFQITDDILGTFGDEFESGKSNKDDIRDGKATILVSLALAKATPQQKKELMAAIGNPNLTESQYQAARKIMQDTNALDEAKKLAAGHAQLAVRSLKNVPETWKQSEVEFLKLLANYATNRTK